MKIEDKLKDKERHVELCLKTKEEVTKASQDNEVEKVKLNTSANNKLEAIRNLKHDREVMDKDEKKHNKKTSKFCNQMGRIIIREHFFTSNVFSWGKSWAISLNVYLTTDILNYSQRDLIIQQRQSDANK